jgi:hypothetical protein
MVLLLLMFAWPFALHLLHLHAATISISTRRYQFCCSSMLVTHSMGRCCQLTLHLFVDKKGVVTHARHMRFQCYRHPFPFATCWISFRSFFQNVTNNQSSFVLLLSALLLAAFRCRTRNNKAIMVTIPYKSFSARKFVARSNQARYQSNMYTMQRVILMPVKWQ